MAAPDLSFHREQVLRYINIKLAALGQPTSRVTADPEFLEIARPLLSTLNRRTQLQGHALCPADARVQTFLDSYLSDVCPSGAPRLPARTFVLDRPGLARALSLPATADKFSSPYIQSYRVPQGILHNPASDRRTTQGIFHIVEGGLPIPADKFTVPKRTFAALLERALHPPAEVLALPLTADQDEQARLMVSLLLRPIVCPATGRDPAKSMEIRFFAPASLISNLDFVEGIFGNAGDPFLPENDAALDVQHWTGHTGCVILAPHLAGVRKKDLGLPHFEEATEQQRRDGMCWRSVDEPYNQGGAFKATCRDHRGVMVTIITDNYFGYCKKEVKTQISYAANLFGLAEEEHAGGAIAFPAYVLGAQFLADRTFHLKECRLDQALALLGDGVELRPEGFAVDRRFPDVLYVPETAEFHVSEGVVRWRRRDAPQQLPLRPDVVYVLPSGYRVRLEKQTGTKQWRLIGVRPDGVFCHKPCTVSGGGKSEISKSLSGALLQGPVIVRDFRQDMDRVADVLGRDFSTIYRHRPPDERSRRPILSPERSLGSVIKLLTPSVDYTDEHNRWLAELPHAIRQLVCTVKRHYRPDWGEAWREHFTVDRRDGSPGHELKFDNQPLVAKYLRVGFEADGTWRVFKLRPDFQPADKVQTEDDITASAVVPRETLGHLDPAEGGPSVRLLVNCESLLFQRPDDAIHRGADRQAEADIAAPGTLLSNFEPLSREQVRGIIDHVVEFDQYTEPMKRLLEDFAGGQGQWAVSSAHPRLVDGKPSKNPRYLQRRPDLAHPREAHLASVCTRLYRDIPVPLPVHFPVQAVLAGRRGNPPDPGIGLPPLAVYNPIHYQELPELFMDFICSLTGKSPSTTGFGSEGALTKRPFNALPPVIDVNNAVVAAILLGYDGFTTAAGCVGHRFRVDHDLSMIVPELWCRMSPVERSARYLLENGYLEKLEDFNYQGRRVLASRLGYRITALFADHFLGRIFETPNAIFSQEMLQPEMQDPSVFAEGVQAIVEAQRRVALEYFEDGSVAAACPPVKALLHIMASGSYQGRGIEAPEIRSLFTRDSLLASDWYRERLAAKQERDLALWRRHLANLETFRARALPEDIVDFDLDTRIELARSQLSRVSDPAYIEELRGTIGADPRLGMP